VPGLPPESAPMTSNEYLIKYFPVHCFLVFRLTAFVIAVFRQADEYISVEDVKIAQSINWIIANQAANGSFAEPPLGRVIHTDMQVGSLLTCRTLFWL